MPDGPMPFDADGTVDAAIARESNAQLLGRALAHASVAVDEHGVACEALHRDPSRIAVADVENLDLDGFADGGAVQANQVVDQSHRCANDRQKVRWDPNETTGHSGPADIHGGGAEHNHAGEEVRRLIGHFSGLRRSVSTQVQYVMHVRSFLEEMKIARQRVCSASEVLDCDGVGVRADDEGLRSRLECRDSNEKDAGECRYGRSHDVRPCSWSLLISSTKCRFGVYRDRV